MKVPYRIVIFAFLILVISLIYFYFTFFKEQRKLQKLYSDLTPTMKNLVERKLSVIDCEPKKYYNFDNTVCFKCSVGDACFPYAWVQREYGKKMNPVDKPFLLNFKEFDAKIADFYYDGLASLMECTKLNDNTLSCVGSVQFMFNDSSVSFKIFEKENLPIVAELICDKLGYGKPSCKDYECSCSNFKILVGKVTEDVYYKF